MRRAVVVGAIGAAQTLAWASSYYLLAIVQVVDDIPRQRLKSVLAQLNEVPPHDVVHSMRHSHRRFNGLRPDVKRQMRMLGEAVLFRSRRERKKIPNCVSLATCDGWPAWGFFDTIVANHIKTAVL